MRRGFLTALCFTFLASAMAAAGAPAYAAEPAERARAQAIEERLVAPCCWNQTLDVHESELASELRREILERTMRGESSEAIQDDLAARYGERIRAVPRGKDPRTIVPVVIGASMLLTALGLVWLARRWMRRGAAANTDPDGGARDDYDQKLEEELLRH